MRASLSGVSCLFGTLGRSCHLLVFPKHNRHLGRLDASRNRSNSPLVGFVGRRDRCPVSWLISAAHALYVSLVRASVGATIEDAVNPLVCGVGASNLAAGAENHLLTLMVRGFQHCHYCPPDYYHDYNNSTL